jgi:hypothetical protein
MDSQVLNTLKTQLRLNAVLLRRNWFYLPGLILAFWIHSICTNIVYRLYIDNLVEASNAEFRLTPLVDTLRTIIHKTSINEELWGTSYALCISNGVISTLALLFVPTYSRVSQNKPLVLTIHVFRRFVFCYALAVLLRCMSFLVTLLPGDMDHCKISNTEALLSSKPTSVWDFLFRVEPEKGCGDLIFSGHTLTLCLLTFSACTFSPFLTQLYLRRVHQLLSITCLITFVCTTIAAGRHYSVDVVIAIYTTLFIWYLSLTFKFLDESTDSSYLESEVLSVPEKNLEAYNLVSC